MSETILITGVLGQDGAYLAHLALEMGHRVVGGTRRSLTMNNWRLRELGIEQDVEIVDLDLLDEVDVRTAIEAIRPSRVFNLAGQSSVSASFQHPLLTSDAGALGVLRLLEAIRTVDGSIRFYQASTSEMFGLTQEVPQRETTPLYPRSPYGVAKAFGHYITRNYREAYGLHCSSGILFNHESPLRGVEFVTRKITTTLTRIATGSPEILRLGNLDAQRDWGHAKDYVSGMWLMTEQRHGGDYVLATGVSTQVREFVRIAAEHVGIALTFSGSGADEAAHDRSGRLVVQVAQEFFRPSDVDRSIGDSARAREVLGWAPKYDLADLIADMMSCDLRRARARIPGQ